jgi:hypothetical protein
LFQQITVLKITKFCQHWNVIYFNKISNFSFKLVRSPGENEGGQGAQKDLHPRTGRDETKGKTQEKMERGSRKRSSSAGSEKMESW